MLCYIKVLFKTVNDFKIIKSMLSPQIIYVQNSGDKQNNIIARNHILNQNNPWNALIMNDNLYFQQF